MIFRQYFPDAAPALVVVVYLRAGAELGRRPAPLPAPVRRRFAALHRVVPPLRELALAVFLAHEHAVHEAPDEREEAEHEHEDAQVPHEARLQELEHQREAEADEDERQVEEDHEAAQPLDAGAHGILDHLDLPPHPAAAAAGGAGRHRRRDGVRARVGHLGRGRSEPVVSRHGDDHAQVTELSINFQKRNNTK